MNLVFLATSKIKITALFTSKQKAKLIYWKNSLLGVKLGPEKAEVRDVVVLQYEELKHYESFEIRRPELL